MGEVRVWLSLTGPTLGTRTNIRAVISQVLAVRDRQLTGFTVISLDCYQREQCGSPGSYSRSGGPGSWAGCNPSWCFIYGVAVSH